MRGPMHGVGVTPGRVHVPFFSRTPLWNVDLVGRCRHTGRFGGRPSLPPPCPQAAVSLWTKYLPSLGLTLLMCKVNWLEYISS